MKTIRIQTPKSYRDYYKSHLIAFVSDEDYDRVKRHNWFAFIKSSSKIYARTGTGKRGEYIQLHKFITGYSGPLIHDHIDGNGLNNTQENIRIVTNSQNMLNQKRKVKGYYKIGSGKYAAKLGVNGYLGVFDTPEEASAAYEAAKVKAMSNARP